MFGTNLAFQQRDLALEISFHSEIITKGSPPKCFQAYGVVFFLLAHTGTGSHNDPLLIVKKMAEETHVTSTCNALWERYKMADKSSLNNVSDRK